MRYQSWIDEFHSKYDGRLLGKCKQAVKEMLLAFPELVECRGHVYCPAPWGKHQHCWCKSPDGSIIDPTSAQFPAIIYYEEWKSGDELSLGRCMNCGDDITACVDSLDNIPPKPDFCGDSCYASFAASLMRGLRV